MHFRREYYKHEVTFELYAEHDIAEEVINDIGSTSSITSDNERWLAKVTVLNDMISHHFKIEEDEIFPKAKDILSNEEAKDLGRRYMNEKTQM